MSSRRVVETWFSVDWIVKPANLPLAGEDGQPLFDAHGMPRTQPVTMLEFTRHTPEGPHVLRIPFTDEAKQGLIAGLTGGIIVPSNGTKLPGG